MDNEVISQAITLTLIGVGTAFVLLIVLMLTTRLMSFVLARFISRNLMVRGGEIDSSGVIDNNKDKVVAASLGVAAYRALLSKEKSN